MLNANLINCSCAIQTGKSVFVVVQMSTQSWTASNSRTSGSTTLCKTALRSRLGEGSCSLLTKKQSEPNSHAVVDEINGSEGDSSRQFEGCRAEAISVAPEGLSGSQKVGHVA